MPYSTEYRGRFYKRIVPDIRSYERACIYECTAKGCTYRTINYGAMRIHAIKKHNLQPIKKCSAEDMKKRLSGVGRLNKICCDVCGRLKEKSCFTLDTEEGWCDKCFNERKKAEEEENKAEEEEREEEQRERIEKEAAAIRAAEEEKKRLAFAEEQRRREEVLQAKA